MVEFSWEIGSTDQSIVLLLRWDPFAVEYSCSCWKRVTAVPCNGLRTLRRWCNYAALLHAVHSFCLLHIFIRFLRVRNSRWNFHLKTCWFHFLIAQSGSTSPSVLVQVPSWWFRRRGERVVASSTFVFLSERRCRLHIPGMKTLKRESWQPLCPNLPFYRQANGFYDSTQLDHSSTPVHPLYAVSLRTSWQHDWLQYFQCQWRSHRQFRQTTPTFRSTDDPSLSFEFRDAIPFIFKL